MRSSKTLALAAAALCALAAAVPASAQADGPAGHDPAANIPLGSMPDSCDTAPASSDCIAAVVTGLNQARADLGQGPYGLPTGFAQLTGEQQMFVLTNLDRVAVGLPAIPGLTGALSADAAGGVRADNDPSSSDPTFGYWTANWAGGYPNAVMAYYDWMYDDGPGSGNLDCTASNPSGCWGHRHDVLWQFGGTGTLAMGASAGTDPSGTPGYALLLGQGDASYHPSYTYTWSQAVAAGANGGAAGPAPGAPGGAAGSGGGTGAGAVPGGARGQAGTPTTRRSPAVASSVARRRRAHRARRRSVRRASHRRVLVLRSVRWVLRFS